MLELTQDFFLYNAVLTATWDYLLCLIGSTTNSYFDGNGRQQFGTVIVTANSTNMVLFCSLTWNVIIAFLP